MYPTRSRGGPGNLDYSPFGIPFSDAPPVELAFTEREKSWHPLANIYGNPLIIPSQDENAAPSEDMRRALNLDKSREKYEFVLTKEHLTDSRTGNYCVGPPSPEGILRAWREGAHVAASIRIVLIKDRETGQVVKVGVVNGYPEAGNYCFVQYHDGELRRVYSLTTSGYTFYNSVEEAKAAYARWFGNVVAFGGIAFTRPFAPIWVP